LAVFTVFPTFRIDVIKISGVEVSNDISAVV